MANRQKKKTYYDQCQEKVVSGKQIPCYEKKGAKCKSMDGTVYDCDECRYFPKK